MFIGPVGSSLHSGPLSTSILDIKLYDTPDGSNGVDLGYSDVVRTTEAMVIHSADGAFRERQEKTTKREIALTSMRGPLLLSAPAT